MFHTLKSWNLTIYVEPETVVRRSKKETAETDGKRKTVLEQIVIAQSGNYSHFNQTKCCLEYNCRYPFYAFSWHIFRALNSLLCLEIGFTSTIHTCTLRLVSSSTTNHNVLDNQNTASNT